jgi:hypothetical protein
MPTDTLERSVESKEIKLQRSASCSGISYFKARSKIGLPYLLSPIWKKGVSGVAAIKLPYVFQSASVFMKKILIFQSSASSGQKL